MIEKHLRFGMRDWTAVGIFNTGTTGFNSEALILGLIGGLAGVFCASFLQLNTGRAAG